MTNHKQLAQTWMTAFSLDLTPPEAPLTSVVGRRRSTDWGTDSITRRLASASLRFTSASASVRALPRRARLDARRQPRGTHQVLSQEFFRNVLAREKQCSHRFEQRHVLLLVGADRYDRIAPAAAAAYWSEIIDALTIAAGDTAVVGWVQSQSVLGAVAPEVTGYDPEAILRRELTGRLGADKAASLSVRSHVYSHDNVLKTEPAAAAATAPDQPSFSWRNRAREGVKRALDILGSLELLLLLSPVFLLVAVLMKLTSAGPILFRQRRIGRMGKPFTMLKFRTMRVGADHTLHQQFVTTFIKSGAQLQTTDSGAIFKLTNDPRVTPLGRILRKASIDELPQLWNVLRGEMSLVGPRPPLAYEVEQYRPWHWRRVVDAKPGITGLWQVNGRSQTTFDDMVRLDLRYARSFSLWVDIKILLATPRAVISGKGAA